MTRSSVALCACVLGWSASASAATLTVNAGGNLQAAIDAAKPGDTILLQAGATFTGSFKLPAKSGTTYITIRSSTPDSQLPPAGTRITPASAPLLAKIQVDQRRVGDPHRRRREQLLALCMFLEFSPSSLDSSATSSISAAPARARARCRRCRSIW